MASTATVVTIVDVLANAVSSDGSPKVGKWLIEFIEDPAKFFEEGIDDINATIRGAVTNILKVDILNDIVGSLKDGIISAAIKSVVEALIKRIIPGAGWALTLVDISKFFWDRQYGNASKNEQNGFNDLFLKASEGFGEAVRGNAVKIPGLIDDVINRVGGWAFRLISTILGIGSLGDKINDYRDKIREKIKAQLKKLIETAGKPLLKTLSKWSEPQFFDLTKRKIIVEPVKSMDGKAKLWIEEDSNGKVVVMRAMSAPVRVPESESPQVKTAENLGQKIKTEVAASLSRSASKGKSKLTAKNLQQIRTDKQNAKKALRQIDSASSPTCEKGQKASTDPAKPGGQQGSMGHNASAPCKATKPMYGDLKSVTFEDENGNDVTGMVGTSVTVVLNNSSVNGPRSDFNTIAWFQKLRKVAGGPIQMGHILASSLGGTGEKEWQNLTPLFADANAPAISTCENFIAKLVSECMYCVTLTITVIGYGRNQYADMRGRPAFPSSILIEWSANNGCQTGSFQITNKEDVAVPKKCQVDNLPCRKKP